MEQYNLPPFKAILQKDIELRSKNLDLYRDYLEHCEEYLQVISDSIYFDEEWYLNTYVDVKNSGIPAVVHYYFYGSFEGRDPSILFSTSKYKKKYEKDVLFLNSLLHYELFGKDLGFIPYNKDINFIISGDINSIRNNKLAFYLTASEFFHIKVWLDCLDDFLISKLVVITLDPNVYNKCIETYSSINVIFIKNTIDLEYVLKNVCTKLTHIFYPSCNPRNDWLVKHNELTHILVGHGDSDKYGSAHKVHRMFDQIWVASKAGIDRYKNAGFDISRMFFLKVGRPSLNNLLRKDKKSTNEKSNILYLPTFEGVDDSVRYFSLPIMYPCIEKIFALHNGELDFTIKLHPAFGVREPTLIDEFNNFIELSKFNINVSRGDLSIQSFLENCNICICDISSVITECLSINCPIFVYINKNKNIKSTYSNMSIDSYTYTFSSEQEFFEKYVRVIINGDDYLKTKRMKAKDYFIGIKETLSNKFQNELLNMCK